MSDVGRLPGIGAYRRPQPRLTHHIDLSCDPARTVTEPARLTPDLAFFHDGHQGIALRLGPGPAVLEAAGFDGAYASLACDLPDAMIADLSAAHDLRLHLRLAPSPEPSPGALHARLCVEDNGPPWRMSAPLDPAASEQTVPLGPGEALPARIPRVARRAWVDLVASEFTQGQLVIAALILTRAPAPVL